VFTAGGSRAVCLFDHESMGRFSVGIFESGSEKMAEKRRLCRSAGGFTQRNRSGSCRQTFATNRSRETGRQSPCVCGFREECFSREDDRDRQGADIARKQI